MEPVDPSSLDEGLIRRMRAIDKAGADSNFDADFVAAARAAIASYSDKDLKAMATMHLLFTDDAPMETIEAFWLSKRLAAERLAGKPDGV